MNAILWVIICILIVVITVFVVISLIDNKPLDETIKDIGSDALKNRNIDYMLEQEHYCSNCRWLRRATYGYSFVCECPLLYKKIVDPVRGISSKKRLSSEKCDDNIGTRYCNWEPEESE